MAKIAANRHQVTPSKRWRPTPSRSGLFGRDWGRCKHKTNTLEAVRPPRHGAAPKFQKSPGGPVTALWARAGIRRRDGPSPPPDSQINLLVYHGVLAPHARWRPHVVGYGRAAPEAAIRGAPENRQGLRSPLRNWTWAALMRRAFAIDVLACLRCGGRLRVIATVEDPLAVRQILAAAPLGPGPPPGASAIAP